MDTIKMALVGYGMRGQDMYKLGVGSFAGIEAAGICDAQPEARRKAAEDFPDIAIHDDFEKMLDACRPDAVLVATPGDYHAELCVKALARGVHVLSEIPSVNSYDEAAKLWDAHLKSTAMYMASANPNLWGFVEEAVALKRKGELGEPFHMEAEYIHDIRNLLAKTPWRNSFVPIKYCTHSLGPLLRLIDEDLETVCCFGTGGHINPADGYNDAMTALFKTKSSIVVKLTVSFSNNCPFWGHRYRIYSTKGYFERMPVFGEGGGAEFKTYFYSADHEGRKMSELPVGYSRPGITNAAGGHGGADHAIFDAFYSALRGDRMPPISLREGLRMTLPGISAAESAARGGEPVKIRYPWE